MCLLYFAVLPWHGMETKYRINISFTFIEEKQKRFIFSFSKSHIKNDQT